MNRSPMLPQPGDGRLERGASALAAIAIAAAVAAVFLPWDTGPVMAADVTAETGLGDGWGFLSLAVTAIAARLVLADDWGRTAIPVAGVGVALAAVALASTLTSDGGTGAGVSLTLVTGLTIVLAGAVGAASVGDPMLPRPLAGLPVSRRLTGAAGAAGVLLVVGFVAVQVVTVGAGFSATSGTFPWLAFLALVGLVGGLLAWSRPVALPYALLGVVAVAPVVASWLPSSPQWGFGVGNAPLDGTLLLVGGLALLLSGLLELGGAGYPVSDDGHGDGEGGTTSAGQSVR